ncbi:Magnesium transporter NIPA2 [Leucoagaricus sp. SymC.cos]|nr:Magnesium transporter NIPA2 [Leucoagaricus sp. SymC.cos]
MVEDKYIGLALAVSSSLAIGTSFIITKKGLNDAAERNAYGAQASDNLSYLRNPIWWAGMSTLVLGEVANFAAYTFAPPILVTPLGALSVFIGSFSAVLASFLLNEELGHLGRLGCTLCLIGSLIIVLHAPEDQPVETVDEILHYALQPGFLMYCFTVLVFSLVMIYAVVPRYGRSNPVVYISICSLVGSVSVMAIKGFGVAVKLTLSGKNQFTHPSTYVFGIVVALCILVQMNYFNKALDTFSTNVVNPMYYVGFSSCTIVASLILFQGFNTTDGTNTVSLLMGFIVTFLGVHLLNISRIPASPIDANSHSALEGGLLNPRLSLQGRMSLDGWSGVAADRTEVTGAPRTGSGQHHHRRSSSSLYRSQHRGVETLFNAYDGPDGLAGGSESVGLHELREEDESDDDDDADERTHLAKNSSSGGGMMGMNGHAANSNGGRSPLHPKSPASASRSHSHSPSPGAFAAFKPLIEKNQSLISSVAKKAFKYGETDRHYLDIYYPPVSSVDPTPILFFVYGGGFVKGDRNRRPPYNWMYSNLGSFFARQGLITIIPDYRLAPDHKFPTASQDVLQAIQWALSNVSQLVSDSTPNPDVDSLFVMGHSAGGSHTTTLTFHPDLIPAEADLRMKIKGIVLVGAPYYYYRKRQDSIFEAHWGSAEEARANSGISLLLKSRDTLPKERLPKILLVKAEFEPEWIMSLGVAFWRLLEWHLEKPVEMNVAEKHNHLSLNCALSSGEGEEWGIRTVKWIKNVVRGNSFGEDSGVAAILNDVTESEDPCMKCLSRMVRSFSIKNVTEGNMLQVRFTPLAGTLN